MTESKTVDNQKLIEGILSIPAEDRTIEFTRLGADLKSERVLESIVAMANTDGGTFVFGVDDPEKTRLKGIDRVFGVEENLELFDELGRSVARISPPIPSLWQPLMLECTNGKRIALLAIPKAVDSFHSINNHVFIRLEKGNKQLKPNNIFKLSYAKGFQKADKELVDVDFDLLKTEDYEKWKKSRKIEIAEIRDVLFQTGLARKDEKGNLKPTRAAVLLFALYPNNLMETKCSIRVFQYEGNIETIKETLNLI